MDLHIKKVADKMGGKRGAGQDSDALFLEGALFIEPFYSMFLS